MAFIDDGVLFDDKLPLRSLPDGADPRKYPRASDMNALKSAAVGLRTAVLGVQPGFVDPNVAMVTATGASAARALQSHVADVVNVRNFGATGDGSTDDTEAIRAAITSARRAEVDARGYWRKIGTGGVVYFPAGVYRITDTVAIEPLPGDDFAGDGVALVGAGRNATAIKVDTGGTEKDGITFGHAVTTDGTTRTSRVSGMTIYAASERASCRDLLAINATTWWIVEEVNLYSAGRYGLAIHGSMAGYARSVISEFNGECGLFIGSATNDFHTTTQLDQFYTASNQKAGVRIAKAFNVLFNQLVSEGNGQNGVDDDKTGIEIGCTADEAGYETYNGLSAVTLVSPYFENNDGWDIKSGTALTGGNRVRLNVIGPTFTSVGKTSGYGLGYFSRTDGSIEDPWINSVAAGTITFSVDSTCRLNLRGACGDQALADAPVNRSGTLDDYRGGLIQWQNGSTSTLYGQFVTDIMDAITAPDGTGRVDVTYSASMTPDAAQGDFFWIRPNDGNAFTVNPPANLPAGIAKEITIMISNVRGDAGSLGAVTFASVGTGAYRTSGTFTQPADGYSRSIVFRWDGTNFCREIMRSAADVQS